MSQILVEVWLYGECARYANKTPVDGVASLNVKLSTNSTLQDLLDYLLICTREFDTLFINGQLSTWSNKQLDLNHPLQDGDRIDLLASQYVKFN